MPNHVQNMKSIESCAFETIYRILQIWICGMGSSTYMGSKYDEIAIR